MNDLVSARLERRPWHRPLVGKRVERPVELHGLELALDDVEQFRVAGFRKSAMVA